jgi:hypothetical protein
MRPKAYADALKLTASALFGTTVRELDGLFDHLIALIAKNSKQPSDFEKVAVLATMITLYLLFFRNLHGFFSYDVWSQEHRDKLPADGVRDIWAVLIPFLGLLVGPYLTIHILATSPSVTQFPIAYTLLFWACMFGIYLPWDFVLWMNTQPQAGHVGSDELHSIISNWVACDGMALLGVLAMAVAYMAHGGKLPVEWTFGCFLASGISVLLFDYSRNRRFYFLNV